MGVDRTLFFAHREGFLSKKTLQVAITATEVQFVETSLTSKTVSHSLDSVLSVEVLPAPAIGCRITLKKQTKPIKLTMRDAATASRFLAEFNVRRDAASGAPPRVFEGFKLSRTAGRDGMPARVPVRLSVSANAVLRYATDNTTVLHKYALHSITRLQAMTHEPDAFVMFFRSRRPQKYWCSNRSQLLETLKSTLRAAAMLDPVAVAANDDDYHAALQAAGDEVSATAPAAHRALLRDWMASAVVVAPVLKAIKADKVPEGAVAPAEQESKAQAGEGDAAAARAAREHAERRASFAASHAPPAGMVSRTLAVSDTHVMELTGDGKRVLHRRPLTDVESVSLPPMGDGGVLLCVAYRSDGSTKTFVPLACGTMGLNATGSAVLRVESPAAPAEGGPAWRSAARLALAKRPMSLPSSPLPANAAVASGHCSAASVGEVLAANIVSAAAAVGNAVDVLTAPVGDEFVYDGNRQAAPAPKLHAMLLRQVRDLDGDATPAGAVPVLSTFVANVPRQDLLITVRGAVQSVLGVLLHALRSVAAPVETPPGALQVALLAMAALDRATWHKPGFDETRTPACRALLKDATDVLRGLPVPKPRDAVPADATDAHDLQLYSLHRAKYIALRCLGVCLVLRGPSKRNPQGGALPPSGCVPCPSPAATPPSSPRFAGVGGGEAGSDGVGADMEAAQRAKANVGPTQYKRSHHEEANRRELLTSDLTTLLASLLVSDPDVGAGGAPCGGGAAALFQPGKGLGAPGAVLATTALLSLLDSVLYSHRPSTPGEAFAGLVWTLLQEPDVVSPSTVLPVSVLGELCAVPVRGLSSSCANVLWVLLTEAKEAARSSTQLYARDTGLLLRTLWAVVTYRPSPNANGDRAAACRLLGALVAGNPGLVHILRRAFPPGLHPSAEVAVQFDEYGRIAGYHRTSAALVAAASGGAAGHHRRRGVGGNATPGHVTRGSVAEDLGQDMGSELLDYLSVASNLHRPVRRWSVLWGATALEELRRGLTAELVVFEAVRYAGASTGDATALFRGPPAAADAGRRVVWNAPDFEVAYPSLESEVVVGPFILRLLFPGGVGKPVGSVAPTRALSSPEAQELLSLLLFRMVGDADSRVKLGCARAMERVISTAATMPSPLLILGHTVHLVCVANGVVPTGLATDAWQPVSASTPASQLVVAGEALRLDLQYELLGVWKACLGVPANIRRWWLAGGVTAVVSVLHRTLGHFEAAAGPWGAAADSDSDGEDGEERKAPPTPASPRSPTSSTSRGSWLFGPCTPSPEDVAARCLDVLYQVALVASGDEGVGGGSGGRISGAGGGQRSRKVYTPAARIFRRLAQPDVVGAVAQTLRARSPALVDTALALLETALVWCRAADASGSTLARTGLFELLLQVRTKNWERPARILAALHLSQVPAHDGHASALGYLHDRAVAHGAAVDVSAAAALVRRHPSLARSCVGHLLPEGLLLVLVHRAPSVFARTFTATYGVNNPELRWTPAMRAALCNAVSDFVDANTVSLAVPVAHTPAPTSRLRFNFDGDGSGDGDDDDDAPAWFDAPPRAFQWPTQAPGAGGGHHRRRSSNPEDGGPMLAPWFGPTVVYGGLRRRLQCGGLFLNALNHRSRALSWPIPDPDSFVPLVTARLRQATQSGAAALASHPPAAVPPPTPTSAATPPPPDVHPDHATALLDSGVLVRTLGTMFQRAAAAGDALPPCGAALHYRGMPTLVASAAFVLDSVMAPGTLAAGGKDSGVAMGPGGFVMVRLAAAALLAVKVSPANAVAFSGCGGVQALAACLGVVRSVEAVSPDPCLRHLDLGMPHRQDGAAVVTLDDASQLSGGDGDSTSDDDDSDLEHTLEDSLSPMAAPGLRVEATPLAGAVETGRRALVIHALCAVSLLLNTLGKNGRPAAADAVARTLPAEVVRPEGEAKAGDSDDDTGDALDTEHHRLAAWRQLPKLSAAPVDVLLRDVLHFAVPATDGDGNSVSGPGYTRTLVVSTAAEVRSPSVALQAIRTLTEAALVGHSLMGPLLRAGTLWYLLHVLLNVDALPKVSTAAMLCLRVVLRSAKAFGVQYGRPAPAAGGAGDGDDGAVLAACKQAEAVVKAALPAGFYTRAVEGDAADADLIKELFTDHLDEATIWTQRVRHELMARVQHRVAALEAAAANPAVEPPAASSADDTWGQEEAGLEYTCLQDEVRISGVYLRYLQDTPGAKVSRPQAFAKELVAALAGFSASVEEGVSRDHAALAPVLRRASALARGAAGVVVKHGQVAAAMVDAASMRVVAKLAAAAAGAAAAGVRAGNAVSSPAVALARNAVDLLAALGRPAPAADLHARSMATPSVLCQVSLVLQAVATTSKLWHNMLCLQLGGAVLDSLHAVAATEPPDVSPWVITQSARNAGAVVALVGVLCSPYAMPWGGFPDGGGGDMEEERRRVVASAAHLLRLLCHMGAGGVDVAKDVARFVAPRIVEEFLGADTWLQAAAVFHTQTSGDVDGVEWNVGHLRAAAAAVDAEWEAWLGGVVAAGDSGDVTWSPTTPVPDLPRGFPDSRAQARVDVEEVAA